MTLKVVVTDNIFPDLDIEREALKAIGATLEEYQCKNVEEIIDKVKDADALLNIYAIVSKKTIDSLEKCKIIARYGIGVDTIDLEAARERGIYVTNVPDYCVDEVSDHAMALLLASVRKIVPLHRTVQSGIWSIQEQRPMYRLRGQTLGFMGFGKIARLVKEKAAPFGFKFIAYDPFLKESPDKEVDLVELQDLFSRSDYLSLHTPLTPETRGMVNYSLLSLMKPTAIIINTARGPVINEDDLVKALDEKKIGGAALDVLKQEAISKDDPLLGRDNVIITPHAAYYSEEATVEQRNKAVMQIIKTFRNEKPDYLV
ncbi:MAG: C-terminal binding protein [Bacillota bacterium]|nr:C-terminal binding protein [Bacillota bacterium]